MMVEAPQADGASLEFNRVRVVSRPHRQGRARFQRGHFITFGGTCERLHGHNYHVAAEVAGPLDENHLVIDFLLVRAKLREIAT